MDKMDMDKPKILLALLPTWTPLIPPQGIARIKGYLQKHNYHVKTVDLNLENEFRDLHKKYFETLQKYIPPAQCGNIYNIGNDALRDHMMAHINYEDEAKYIELVKIIIYKVFYHHLENAQVHELNAILTAVFSKLEISFLALLAKEKPNVLGLSVYRDTLPASLFIFRVTKKKYPGMMTVMGGSVFTIHLAPGSPNLEFFMAKTVDCIDKIIIGEGEQPLLKLLEGEPDNSRRLYTKEDIQEETLGFVPLDMYDFSDFSPGDYNYMAAQGSTSCPNNCSFCNVASFYGAYRQKEAAQTVDEMIYVYQKFGNKLFYMLDALLNNVVTDIAQEFVRRNLTLYWDGYFRIQETCPREMTLTWRRGGFYRARIGVESGSQRVLDLMNKGITVSQIRETISNLAYAGIKTTAYIVIGHPGETEEDFQQTLDLITDLKNDIWEAECNPFTYLYSGQGKSDAWANQRVLLYPPWAKDILITQTWIVNEQPSREEMFSRIARFVEHCKKLGVSIPWSLQDVTRSDQRWLKLHKNAVPPVFDLMKRHENPDEAKNVREILTAKNSVEEENFDF